MRDNPAAVAAKAARGKISFYFFFFFSHFISRRFPFGFVNHSPILLDFTQFFPCFPIFDHESLLLDCHSILTMDLLSGPATAVISIGTRKSILARAQAEDIAAQLEAAWPETLGEKVSIKGLVPLGDRDKTTALWDFSAEQSTTAASGEKVVPPLGRQSDAKGLWTNELEDELERGGVDVIVHCLKGECGLLIELKRTRQSLIPSRKQIRRRRSRLSLSSAPSRPARILETW